MKPNELMIGDWVFNNETKNHTQIDDILCDGVNGEWDGQECYGVARFDNIEPIPLTEEILKANGFYQNKSGKWQREGMYAWTANPIMIDITDSDCGIDAGYTELQYAEIVFSFQYVHKLQHALRICGFDDIADNFKLR